MATRSRKEVLRYRDYRNSPNFDGCVFCTKTNNNEDIIFKAKDFYVIKNIFPYDVWDSMNVEEHYMIVPLKHTSTLSDLTADESIEFVGLLASYESKGFNVYARAPHSTMKTVEHQHTHLIKPSTKKTRLLLYIRKPYIRLIKH